MCMHIYIYMSLSLSIYIYMLWIVHCGKVILSVHASAMQPFNHATPGSDVIQFLNRAFCRSNIGSGPNRRRGGWELLAAIAVCAGRQFGWGHPTALVCGYTFHSKLQNLWPTAFGEKNRLTWELGFVEEVWATSALFALVAEPRCR